MDFDEMRDAINRANKYTTERLRREFDKFPNLTTSYLEEKARLEHMVQEIPKALNDRAPLNEFMDRTKMGFAEATYMGWEQIGHFLKDYDRLKTEVTRLSADLKRQRNEVLSILQTTLDQIARLMRETIDERTPPEYGEAHDNHQEG